MVLHVFNHYIQLSPPPTLSIIIIIIIHAVGTHPQQSMPCSHVIVIGSIREELEKKRRRKGCDNSRFFLRCTQNILIILSHPFLLLFLAGLLCGAFCKDLHP